MSDDNVFIEGRRQRPLSKKKIESWVNEVFMTFTEEEQKNYNRNRQLIDLSCIPPELEEKIINEFIDAKVASRDKILNYFITKKLKTLIEVIRIKFGKNLFKLILFLSIFYMLIFLIAEVTAVSILINYISGTSLWITASIVIFCIHFSDG